MSTELEEGTDAKSASSFQSPLRTLLIDNYDSFSYNIVQLMAVEYGAEPIVVYNDTPWHVVRDLLPKVDAVVISPGPGHPAVPKDIGVCDPILRHCSLPIFGVCLGLQGLVVVEGGRVVHAREPMHGRQSSLILPCATEDDKHARTHGLFAYVPDAAPVVRYNSLVAETASMPRTLRVTAWARTGANPDAPLQLCELDDPLARERYNPAPTTAAAAAADTAGAFSVSPPCALSISTSSQPSTTDAPAPAVATAAAAAAAAAGGDVEVMGVEHVSRPIWAVQFHPESICTPSGVLLFRRFRELAQSLPRATVDGLLASTPNELRVSMVPSAASLSSSASSLTASSSTAFSSLLNTDSKTNLETSLTSQASPLSCSLVWSVLFEGDSQVPSAADVVALLRLSSPQANDASSSSSSSSPSTYIHAGPLAWLDSARLGADASSRYSYLSLDSPGQISYFTAERSHEAAAAMHLPRGALRETAQPVAVLEGPALSPTLLSANSDSSSSLTALGIASTILRLLKPARHMCLSSSPSNPTSLMHPAEATPSNDDMISLGSFVESAPFEMEGGLITWLGYELKSETLPGWMTVTSAPSTADDSFSSAVESKDGGDEHKILSPAQRIPDALFHLATRMLIWDHKTHTIFAATLVRSSSTATSSPVTASSSDSSSSSGGGRKHLQRRTVSEAMLAVAEQLLEEDEAVQWVHRMRSMVRGAQGKAAAALQSTPAPALATSSTSSDSQPINVHREDRAQYVRNVKECLQEITNGESYELCVTTRSSALRTFTPLELYFRLRVANSAPFGAFVEAPLLPFPVSSSSSFLARPRIAVLSCSPERLLSVTRDGVVSTKPIKGTLPRGKTAEEDDALHVSLATGSKERAENLMIADLARSDLGRVCRTGSVRVPKLMHVERYATVLQLVTTVEAQLREHMRATDVVQAIFPAGSMTGAPKLRSCQILQRIEGMQNRRGIYSGALGYFGLSGTASLSVVIRTAVCVPAFTSTVCETPQTECLCELSKLSREKAHASSARSSESPTGQQQRGTYEISVGAGGAIVFHSDPEAEHDEMLLKGRVIWETIRKNTLPSV